MQTRKMRFIRFGVSCFLITAVASSLVILIAVGSNAPSAFAKPFTPPTPTPVATSTVSASTYVTPGVLSMSSGSVSQPTAIALDGDDHSESFTVPITVNDATGSGAGWNLTVSMTQFDNGGHKLSTSAVSVTGVDVICASGTCTNPSNSVSYTLAVPSDGSTTTTFYSADFNSGMGNFTVTPTFEVSIPASAYAGTYNSVLTISISNPLPG